MQFSVIRQQKSWNAQQSTALCSTDGFIWECKGLATMIKTCQAPDSSHVALSSFYVLPFTSLPTPLWRAIALLDCYFMYYCRRQRQRIKVSRVSLFFSPHLTCYVPPVMQYLAGKSLGWTTLHFSLQLFQLMRVVSWYQCLTKCWRYMQREGEEEEGFDETPIGPPGSKRELMGCWNDG